MVLLRMTVMIVIQFNHVGDADYDGVLTADDCDDNNAFSTVLLDDADCDGARMFGM